jgi:hypothetical protein
MSLAKTVARTQTRSKSSEPTVASFTMAEIDAILATGTELEKVELFLDLIDYVEPGRHWARHIMTLVRAAIEALTAARGHAESTYTAVHARLRANRSR